MAIGEAASVSVHGANRLGSTRCSISLCSDAQQRNTRPLLSRPVPSTIRSLRMRAKKRWRASIASVMPRAAQPTAKLRLDMQRVMQNNCAVFRTGEVLQEGCRSAQRPLEPAR